MDAEPPEDPALTSPLPPIWSEALTRALSPQATVRLQGSHPAPSSRGLDPGECPRRLQGDRPGYQLLKVLGQGGMGFVYEAVQTSLGRAVALKQNRADEASGSPLFLREASLTGKLEHPNIIPIHDLGQDEEGRLFYAMKLVEGRPWSERAREQSLEVNLGILARIMDAIAFAHARGVVHRDLKPSNIMLGDYGEVYVVDWGLAAPIPGPGEPLDEDALFMGGTPAYMAPEIASGTGPGASPSVDIYLLGAILFELLTGAPPHPGSSATDTFLNACGNVLRPLPPPDELLDIALKALATRPQDRYPSVQAMQEALGAYKAHTESRALAALAAKAAEEGTHAGFQGAVFGYREALRLWPGSPAAKAGLSRVLAAYAEAACGWGDLDLAATLLDPADPTHGDLRARIARAQRQRDRRQARLRRLTTGSIALVAILLVTLTTATVLVKRQKDRAVAAQRAEARQRREAQRAQYRLGLSQALSLAAQGKPAEGLELLDSLPAGPRGWEFDLLKRRILARAGRLERIFRKHTGRVYSLAAAPTGDRVATGDDAGTVRIWNASSGEEVRVFRNAPDWVGGLSLAFSPDAGLLALGDGTVRSLADGRIRTRLARASNLFALAFTPDGRRLLGTDYEGFLRLWAMPSGHLLDQLRADHETVFHLALGPGGREVLWGSKDGRLHQVDVGPAGFGRPRILGSLGAPVMSVAWSRQGRYAAGGNDGSLMLGPGGGQPARRVRSPGGALTSLAFSPGGQWLAGGSADGVVRVWEAATGTLAMELPGHEGTVMAVAFTEDGRLATASHDGTARVWQLPAEQAPSAPPEAQRVVSTACLDDARLVAGRQDGTVLCRGIQGGRDLWTARLPPGCAAVLTADAAAGRIFCAGQDGILRALDARDGRILFQAPGSGSATLALAARGGLVAASGRAQGAPGRDVQVWDAKTGQPLSHLTGLDDWACSLAFSPDGTRLAAATVTGGLWVWDTRTWKALQSLPGMATRYMKFAPLAFSPDGRSLVRGTWTQRLELLDTITWKPIQSLRGQTAWSLGAWTPDGRRFVSPSLDGNLRIWDPSSGSPLLLALPLPPGPLTGMGIPPGGHYLILVLDGRIHAWATKP